MSFLESLRNNDSDDTQGQQLHYQLSIDNIKHELLLRLCVVNEKDPEKKPYCLQREHLYRPPAFITQSDKNILRTLSDSDSQWFNSDHGSLPTKASWLFLQEIINTQRCYFVKQDHHKIVEVGEANTIEPYWAINSGGEYELKWQLKQTQEPYKLIFLAEQPAFYYTIDKQRMHIGSVQRLQQHSIAPSQLRIPACDIDTYIKQRQKNWTRWNLPQPQSINSKIIEAEIKPLLSCRTVYNASSRSQNRLQSKNDGGEIQMQFSLCSEQYCSLPSPEVSKSSYWDGTTLHRLEADQNKALHITKTIKRRLTPFTLTTDTPSTWQIQTQKQWQHLFTELYAPLRKLNTSFCVEAGFRHHYAFIENWQVSIEEQESGNLNLSVLLKSKDDDIELHEFLEQLRDFNHHSKESHMTLRRSDGRLWLIPASDVLNLMEELKDLDCSKEGFQLPASQRHRLADLDTHMPKGTHWSGKTQYLNDAIELHQSPVVLSKKLDFINAQLRPYQWLGVCWIQHMKQHACNGLLADDMGLGKTLQTLTHLAFEKQQDKLNKPALIVMPLSLLHNWMNEIKRFAPQLRCKIIHGTKRHDDWEKLGEYDILATTYHLVATDLPHWQTQNISWLILDEAQSIKNPKTRYSKAVREIPCDYKLCLSGTPVENHLGELWSIISFLMPGYLGSQREFKNNFQKPIEQTGDEKQMKRLLSRIEPFILRRTKDQIAQDLPAKTEIEQLIPLYKNQQDFYQQLKHETWQDLQAKMGEEEQNAKNSIAALSALLKLRQACCDPALLSDDFPETDLPSAKREHCIEMIEELVAEKRAVLVFSQFTKMLDILAQTLEEKEIPTLMLTGKSRNRQSLVDAFQRGEAPVFLISLKAGGTGLNLTRADTVIHYDPWWNSAAEKQASDRAHRIGQDKPVFVYKLIAENTVEEKISQLQAKKVALSQHIDNQAQLNAESFAFKFEELLTLWEENKTP